MWNQLWIPILIPTLIIKSNCDDNRTDAAVFVQGGHADAEYQERTTTTTTEKETTVTTTVSTTVTTTTVKVPERPTTPELFEEESKDVVFVPNEKPPVTSDEPENSEHGLKIKDVMLMRSVDDALNKDFHVEKEEDSPNEDIVFITGKNHDLDKDISEETRRQNGDSKNNNNQIERKKENVVKIPKLNCEDLDCNRTVNSICGVRLMDNEWRHRLFMNDCYFRKVNCAFKYEVNRYKRVPLSKCKKIGSRYEARPFQFKLNTPTLKPDLKPRPDARRSFASRRSMSRNINGEFCSHPCPETCPEDYDPTCAISNTGQRRVFLNHCKLDYNSCYYSIVWHKRPLAECVGNQKADMRQNRGFIGWMQRVGIVDKKGRLVLE